MIKANGKNTVTATERAFAILAVTGEYYKKYLQNFCTQKYYRSRLEVLTTSSFPTM